MGRMHASTIICAVTGPGGGRRETQVMPEQNPVIILGMHRSGTSMLSRLLEQSGLFLGEEKDQNNESLFFQKINEWLFTQVNASWDCPENMNYIDPQLTSLLEKSIRYLFSGDGRQQYLGKDNADKYRNITEIDFPWGWKDPRNIFTADIWKSIFPAARLIHICRNPVDVANSIRVRENLRFISIEEYVEASGPGGIVDQG